MKHHGEGLALSFKYIVNLKVKNLSFPGQCKLLKLRNLFGKDVTTDADYYKHILNLLLVFKLLKNQHTSKSDLRQKKSLKCFDA